MPKIQLPFSNVQERLESAVSEEIGERFRGSSDSWMEIDIDDLVVKFKVIFCVNIGHKKPEIRKREKLGETGRAETIFPWSSILL